MRRSTADKAGQKHDQNFICLQIELEINVVKQLRAHGGCLGVRSKGVEGCDKPGGAVKQALIPGYPDNVGN